MNRRQQIAWSMIPVHPQVDSYATALDRLDNYVNECVAAALERAAKDIELADSAPRGQNLLGTGGLSLLRRRVTVRQVVGFLRRRAHSLQLQTDVRSSQNGTEQVIIMIFEPFTDDQVAQLNRYQDAGMMHPFTCPRHSDTSLVAATDGWSCPHPSDCDYTQRWAHPFMADKASLDLMTEGIG